MALFPKAPSKKRSINNIIALRAELKRKEKITKLFKLSTLSSSLKQPYHPTSHHTKKEFKNNSKGNPDYCLKAQNSLPGNTLHSRMIAPIVFAMTSGGAGVPSVNPGDHLRQRSAGATLDQESSPPSMPTLQPKAIPSMLMLMNCLIQDLNLTTPVSLPALNSSAARDWMNRMMCGTQGTHLN
eukprot:763380-Ditylum_brightwellii.AAC.1